MSVLLDTCTLAEVRLPEGNPSVKSAVAEVPDAELDLSAHTVGEIVRGIALLATGRKKRILATWLVGLERQFGDRILAVDLETARIWGEMTARARKIGVAIPGTDGLLAATALRRGMHIMTRNTRHFEASGALVIDPWENS